MTPPSQEDLLSFMRECVTIRGRVSFGDVERKFKLPSRQHAIYYVRKLEKLGLLRTCGARGRQIRLNEGGSP